MQSIKTNVFTFIQGLYKWNYQVGQNWYHIDDNIWFVTLLDTQQVCRSV